VIKRYDLGKGVSSRVTINIASSKPVRLAMGLENRQYYRDEQPYFDRGGTGMSLRTWSIVNIIIAINVVVFLLDAFSPKVADNSQLHWLNSFLAMDTRHPWRIWTLLTHGFAHASLDSQIGIWHLAGNMITLFFLGRPVEQRLGRHEFLKFYLAAILVSGTAFLAVHLLTDETAVVVGASGAVTAVVALFIFMYPKVTIYLMGILPMPAWLLGALLMLMDFGNAFKPGSPIAWEAHLAGAAFGVTYYLMHWNFRWLSFTWLTGLFESKPRLRVHDPGRGAEKLKAQADEILAKIAAHGEESLTGRERKILNKYSQQLRRDRK
jgi:membrane associated rhomboid family serine protease